MSGIEGHLKYFCSQQERARFILLKPHQRLKRQTEAQVVNEARGARQTHGHYPPILSSLTSQSLGFPICELSQSCPQVPTHLESCDGVTDAGWWQLAWLGGCCWDQEPKPFLGGVQPAGFPCPLPQRTADSGKATLPCLGAGGEGADRTGHNSLGFGLDGGKKMNIWV